MKITLTIFVIVVLNFVYMVTAERSGPFKPPFIEPPEDANEGDFGDRDGSDVADDLGNIDDSDAADNTDDTVDGGDLVDAEENGDNSLIIDSSWRFIDDRIINGFTPRPLDNPFVVRLIVTFPDDRQLCTGALLSSSWVVTAGHCGKGAQKIEVQLGLFTRNQGVLQTITVPSKNIFVHENFVASNTEIRNDIALLRLVPRANTLSPRIRPMGFACEKDGNFVGRRARSCGWGDTSDNATISAETLQCVDMPIITNTVCTNSWGTLVLSSNICTGTIRGKTPCAGDSGGPLFVFDLINRPQLIGLTSFGSNPCEQNIPSVYTRITWYSRWITRRTLLNCDFL